MKSRFASWARQAFSAPLLVLSLTLFPATSAHAVCDGCVVGAVQVATTTIASAISAAQGAIVYSQQRIIETIKGVGEVTASMQAQATQTASDANTDTQASMARSANARNWQHPDECGVTAGSHGVAQAAANSPGKCSGRNCPASAGGGGGLSANQVTALNIAAGTRPAPEPEVQAALAASGACASFVGGSSSAARLQRCQVANLPTGASNGNPDADIRAETLFDGPQRDPNRMTRRLTVNADPTSSDYRAVQSLMKNLDTPLELRELRRAELTTDSGRRFMALRDAYDARMAIAQKPAQALLANRMEDKSLIDYVKQLITSPMHGTWVAQRLAKTAPQWQTRGISFDEMIDIEASRRHLNKDWQVRMAEMSAEAHVREQTSMQAFQLYLLSQVNTKLDYIAVASGQQTGTSVRAEMLPQLTAAHQAATK
jgi:hypothetical protein